MFKFNCNSVIHILNTMMTNKINNYKLKIILVDTYARVIMLCVVETGFTTRELLYILHDVQINCQFVQAC